jgi:hypothetical protein
MSQFDPVNDNSEQPFQERRAEARRRVLLTGKLVYAGNSYSANCTIRDLTPRGARIAIDPQAVSDDPFLIVVRQATAYESCTVWRDEREVGLSFIRSIDLSGKTPVNLRAIQRMWLELTPR